MKCIVHDCKNHDHQGAFVGNLCAPCHHMLTTGVLGFGGTFVHRLADASDAKVREIEAEVLEARNEAAVVRRAYLHERLRANTAVSALADHDPQLAKKLAEQAYKGLQA